MEKINQRIIDIFLTASFKQLCGRIILLTAVLLFVPIPAFGLSIISDEETEQFLYNTAAPFYRSANIPISRNKIFIVQDNSLNAFVSDGNNLFIHTGTIMAADNKNELSGVIAHEVGHIAGGHILRSKIQAQEMQRVELASLILAGAAAAAGGQPDTAMAIMLGGQSSMLNAYTSFRTAQERSADEAAVKYLSQNQESPAGMLNFMKKIRAQNKMTGNEENPYFRTHPLTSERINFMEQAMKNSKYKPDFVPEENFARIKAKLSGFLLSPEETYRRYPMSDTSIAAQYARSIADFKALKISAALKKIDDLIKNEPQNPYFRELKAQIYMEKGKSHKLSVSVFDNSGRFIEISDLSSFEIISDDNNIVSVNGNKIHAENNGTCIVSISRGNVASYISVAVGNKKYDYTDGFEKESGKTFLYPSDTIGSFETSDEYSLNGSFSGKLSFDFTNMKVQEENTYSQEDIQPAETVANNLPPADDVARGVYFSLDKDVLVNEDNPLISVSVYTEVPFNHKIKAQIIDGNGKAKNLEFDGEIAEGVWNKLSLSIPEDIKTPVYLSKIYVLYSPGEEKDSGCVYIDDVSLVTGEKYIANPAPLNKYGINSLNANVKSSVFIGAVSEIDNNHPVTEYKNARLKNELKSKNGIVLSESIKKGVSEDDNAVYISLDTSNGGIRGTDSTQWDLLTSTVKSSKKNNVFIITNNGVFGKDDFENEVVRDYLSSIDKNVFVVSMGDSSNCKIINGVKYFEIDSKPVITLCGVGDRKNVLQFSFGDTVTFEFKSI